VLRVKGVNIVLFWEMDQKGGNGRFGSCILVLVLICILSLGVLVFVKEGRYTVV